jgi:hypothetical protein
LLDHKIYGMEVGQVGNLSLSSGSVGQVAELSLPPSTAGQVANLSYDPLILNECTIRGGGADLHVRGQSAIVARDCDFDSIRFAGDGGSVRRQWTVAVRTPTAGCRVAAESEKGAAAPERVEAAADTLGVARLVLTEYVARPGGLDYLRRGQNDSTPHRLTVYSGDGKTVLGEIRNYRVLARGQEVRIP